MTDQTKALLLASQEKASLKPVISFQFYINPSLFFTREKKRVNTANSEVKSEKVILHPLFTILHQQDFGLISYLERLVLKTALKWL